MPMLLSAGIPDYFENTGSAAPTYSLSVEPHAIYDSGTNKTWFVWEAFNGTYNLTHVAVYDHAGQSWSSNYVAGATELVDDPHGNPCILRDADGYWHAFFGDHVTPMQHSVTASPDDPSVWVQQPFVPTNVFAGAGDGPTYPHALLIGSTIWLIHRNGPLNKICYIKSTSITNGVVTWGSLTALLDLADGGGDGRAEPGGMAVSGTDIHFVCCRAPNDDTYRRGVYKVVLHTTTGGISNLDNSVTIAAGSLPANKATMEASFLIADSGAGNIAQYWIPDLCFDSGGGQHFLYVTSADDISFDLKYFNYISGVQSSPVTVTTFTIFSQGCLIALASAAMAIMWNVYDEPGVSGGIWRAVRPSGGPIGSASRVQASTTGFLSGPPERVRNSTTHQVLWFQSESTAASVTGGCKGYCYGDNGYLRRPSFAVWPPGTAVGAGARFNSADKSTLLQVSDNGLVVTSLVGINTSVRSTTSKSSGKFHVEFTILFTKGVTGLAIGIASGSHLLTKYLGEDTTSYGLFGTTSDTFFNNVNTSRPGLAYDSFQVVVMEVDFTANLLWFKNVTTGGNWNGSALANPATGAGGFDISVMTGSPFFFCVNPYDLYGAVAVNTGNLPWALTPSSGFGRW